MEVDIITSYIKFKKKNKDKIKEKIICDICGGHYVYYSKSLHKKSKKHIFCLNKIKNENDKDNDNDSDSNSDDEEDRTKGNGLNDQIPVKIQEKRKSYNQIFAEKNKEKIIEKVKEYNKTNVKSPEKIKEYNKKAYEKRKLKKLEEVQNSEK